MGRILSPFEGLSPLGSLVYGPGDVDVGITSKDASELFFVHRVAIERCMYETKLVDSEKITTSF